ncbi:hypothetical protein [Streptomyces sp. A1136]|uniref:hypothetical protein n=1 Tax=Streptomyces sp. A1136 TaxID=2563102 RepID=UPI00109E5D66|nr:hypothetical protein [Streptomyces sp. A1136]THA56122.1 hypothetical protein E6R62_12310 [Streptomyces sp. A1136]
MDRAPIVVHRISPSGGRRVTFHVRGTDTILGTAYNDADLIEFLRRIEVPDPDELVLGESPLIEWQGDGPHVYEPSPPTSDLP